MIDTKLNEKALRFRDDGVILAEAYENGIYSVKTTDYPSLIKALVKCSDFKTRSGIIPTNTFSFAKTEHSAHICLLFDEPYADISFMDTKYECFPLPRMVFGFRISDDGAVTSSYIGVIEQKGMLRPSTRMFVYPFSNVSGSFRVCTGSNRLPRYDSLHGLESLPYLIIAMPNNLDHAANAKNKHGWNQRELLENLAGQTQDYYYSDVLVESRKTLADFIMEVEK